MYESPSNEQDTKYLNILRGVATIAVISCHVGNGKGEGNDKIIRDIYTAVNVWCVPVFFMISGALYFTVKKELNFKRHLAKTFHFIVLTILWSFIYNLISIVYIEKTFSIKILFCAIIMAIKGSSQYCYHLWYMYCLIGIYLIYPYIKLVLEYSSEFQKKFFLLLGICLSWIIPTLQKIFLVNGEHIQIWDGSFSFYNGFITYIILGYFLHKLKISKFHYKIATICTLFIWGGYILISSFCQLRIYTDSIIVYNSITTAILAVGVFIIIKSIKFHERNIMYKIINYISRYSLSIYIIHVMIIQFLRKILHFSTENMPLVIGIPVLTILTLLICLPFCIIGRKIPIIKKYI